MGWIKQPVRTSESIFNEITKDFPVWNGYIGDSSSPYEYWADYLRDMFDLTLGQCNEVCEMIKAHYKIDNFYYK